MCLYQGGRRSQLWDRLTCLSINRPLWNFPPKCVKPSRTKATQKPKACNSGHTMCLSVTDIISLLSTNKAKAQFAVDEDTWLKPKGARLQFLKRLFLANTVWPLPTLISELHPVCACGMYSPFSSMDLQFPLKEQDLNNTSKPPSKTLPDT